MTTEEVFLIAGMALVTFLTRYPPLLIVGRVPLPKRVFQALRFVPVAVLVAIIAPAMLMPAGTLDIRPQNAYWVAGVVSILIAWRTRNLLWTIIGGMVFFLAWGALVG